MSPDFRERTQRDRDHATLTNKDEILDLHQHVALSEEPQRVPQKI